mgnify:CR=1 FL=1
MLLGLLCSMIVCMLVSAFNGYAIVKLGLPSMITTLAMQQVNPQIAACEPSDIRLEMVKNTGILISTNTANSAIRIGVALAATSRRWSCPSGS